MNFFPQNQNLFDPQQLQRLAQMNQFNQQNVYVNQTDLYTELNNKINTLASDEKSLLLQNEEFVNANAAYEQALLQHIASQYRNQFNQSEVGTNLLKNLDNSLNKAIEASRNRLNSEREEIRKVSELIKNNPEILELLDKKG